MPMPLSLTLTIASPSSQRGAHRDAAAVIGVLGGVVEQVGRTPGSAGADRRRRTSARPRTRWSARGAGCRAPGGWSRSPALTIAVRSSGSFFTSMTPRVMRDTSSRSSTSRLRWWTWRSITAHACRVRLSSKAPDSFIIFEAVRESARAGLRSSWPSVARNSSLRRSALRSACSFLRRSFEVAANLVLARAGAHGGLRRAQQRRHARRPLEQRDVAERAARLRPTPANRRPGASGSGSAGPTRPAAATGTRTAAP